MWNMSATRARTPSRRQPSRTGGRRPRSVRWRSSTPSERGARILRRDRGRPRASPARPPTGSLKALEAARPPRLQPAAARLPARSAAAGARREPPAASCRSATLAHPALERLAAATGESAQLYVRDRRPRSASTRSNPPASSARSSRSARRSRSRGLGRQGLPRVVGARRERDAARGAARRGRRRRLAESYGRARHRPSPRMGAPSAGSARREWRSVSAAVRRSARRDDRRRCSVSGPTSRSRHARGARRVRAGGRSEPGDATSSGRCRLPGVGLGRGAARARGRSRRACLSTSSPELDRRARASSRRAARRCADR